VALVSVIVIGYNDATHLPTAIRSVMRQTLRDIEIIVVDDASTDETPTLTAALAAADPRITVLRREANSGGCSAPRNDGMAVATGRYLMFCDSDDVLTRRACEKLSGAAERADADMACGEFVRRHHDPTRYIAAYRELYGSATVLNGILDRPAQLHDTPPWNKLYRRSFVEAAGLAFPAGLLYEDLLFVTEAYCRAGRIAIVPDLVYVWNVRRSADALSITNRRDLKRWRDRIEVNRRIDAYLADSGAPPELRAAKDARFLALDLMVFLRELREAAPEDRGELLETARDYCAGVPIPDRPGRGEDIPVGCRIGAFMIGQGDIERALDAADLAVTGSASSDLVATGGRLRWTEAYADDPRADAVLDVTDEHWQNQAWSKRPYLAVVSRATDGGAVLRLEGQVHDLLDGLAGVEPRGSVRVTTRVGDLVWSGPLEVDPGQGAVRFAGDVDLVGVGRRLLRPTAGYELRLDIELRRGPETARRPLTARDAVLPATSIALPTPYRWLVGDRAMPVESNGRLVLRLDPPPAYRRAISAASWLRYTAGHGR